MIADVLGFGSGLTPFSSITASALMVDFEINAVGPAILFRAFYPLLQASSGTPKFIAISSIGGQINDALPLPFNSWCEQSSPQLPGQEDGY